MPGVVAADAELTRRGDHAVRHVPVGLAGRDRETAGQDGAGQRDHHEVADREVAGAADDAARPVVPVVGAGVDTAPPDRLLEPGQLLDLDDPTRHQRAPELRAAVHVLDLQADPDERLADRVGVGGQAVDVGGEPGQGDTHFYRSWG